MPWPMVHFAVAQALFGDIPSPSFLIGSIAPDAIHVREKITREDKGRTHLVQEGNLPGAEVIFQTCRQYLERSGDRAWKDFVRGYFTHIYTDLRWTETLYSAFEAGYQGAKESIRAAYNKEVSQIEFILLRNLVGAQSAVFNLEKAKAFSINPLLHDYEIHQYRDEKMSWLKNNGNEPGIIPEYFTEDKVCAFIALTAAELQERREVWE
ncbi:hypothetical protein [Paenibacillus pinistramenti]|uniref:hypothetical protein n=1 Tax=Paenibacillus pinistramenti TaxID=1768003 RepID=UPI001108A10D|nr:hypothetical protein [Paenibacillus pinistramenti]